MGCRQKVRHRTLTPAFVGSTPTSPVSLRQEVLLMQNNTIKDLTHLNWGVTHNNGASYGCYYKATEVINGIKYYYKCSNFYKGQRKFGDESVNEVICSRYLDILGLPTLKYTLVHAKVKIDGIEYTTYVCKSENYFKGYDSRTTLEDLAYLYPNKSPLEIVNHLGIRRDIDKMLVADYLVLQRDRHGKNIEILTKGNRFYLAPLFDNGLGLLAPFPSQFPESNIKDYDVLRDLPVNNYIGTRSLQANLGYLSSPIKVHRLLAEHKRRIFYGLHVVLPDEYINKIWQLLTYRYMFLIKRGIIIHD